MWWVECSTRPWLTVGLTASQYSDIGFSMQISCLIFSPAFYAAGIYLTLKHLVLNFGESYSRIPAYLYTWIFIFCDFISLLLQASGGGIASSANDDMKKLDLGTYLMLGGIVFQVVVLLAFATLVIDYTLRVRRNWSDVSDAGKNLAANKGFKRFAYAVLAAFLGIFIRSVYRIAEMAEGWGKPLMRDETSFMVLEGGMMVITVAALTIFHPGRHFPQMSNQSAKKVRIDTESGSENEAKFSAVTRWDEKRES